MKCLVKNNLRGKKPSKNVKLELTAESGVDEPNKKLAVKAAFDMSVHSEGDESDSLKLNCVFLLLYDLDSVDGLSEDKVVAFTQWIGMNNAWPYVREFVQNMTMRLGLPPLVIPLYKPEKMGAAFEVAESD